MHPPFYDKKPPNQTGGNDQPGSWLHWRPKCSVMICGSVSPKDTHTTELLKPDSQSTGTVSSLDSSFLKAWFLLYRETQWILKYCKRKYILRFHKQIIQGICIRCCIR